MCLDREGEKSLIENRGFLRQWNSVWHSESGWVSLHCCLVTKSYLMLCDPMDCSLPGSSVHGISQARVLECLLLQRIFPTQGLNPSLLHGRWILYHWVTRKVLHVIMRVSKSIECTPEVNPYVNRGLWVIMIHQYRFINSNTCPLGEVDHGGGCACGRGHGICESSPYLPLHIRVNWKSH